MVRVSCPAKLRPWSELSADGSGSRVGDSLLKGTELSGSVNWGTPIALYLIALSDRITFFMYRTPITLYPRKRPYHAHFALYQGISQVNLSSESLSRYTPVSQL